MPLGDVRLPPKVSLPKATVTVELKGDPHEEVSSLGTVACPVFVFAFAVVKIAPWARQST